MGKTPYSRFVGQLCKVTLGWGSSVSTRSASQIAQLAASTSTLPKPLCASSPVKPEVSMTSSKASITSSKVSVTSHSSFQGQYGRRLDYKPPAATTGTAAVVMAGREKPRKRPQRNPSRLYRVVKPLAEIAPAPSPATKRCVGPEFVVMSMEKEAEVSIYITHIHL